MARKQITVIQDKDNLVPTEVLAQEIQNISSGVRKLRQGRLNDRALLLLIQNSVPCSISIKTIRYVLDSIESLEQTYLKKKPAP